MGKPDVSLGNKFLKPDIERLGLFLEMPPVAPKKYIPFRDVLRDVSGGRMLAEGPKIKAGRADCYFEKEFKRLFIGEAIKGRGRKPPPPLFKNVSDKPFMPAPAPKPLVTPGHYYGTFEGKVAHFSNLRRKEKKVVKNNYTFTSSPTKFGGPGYANIGINPYPSHSADRYGAKKKYKDYGRVLDGPMIIGERGGRYFDKNPFPDSSKGPTYGPPKTVEKPFLAPGYINPTGPTKWLGGMKGGCFDKYPESNHGKYMSIYEVLKPSKPKPIAGNYTVQSHGFKTLQTTSIIACNMKFKFNSRTLNDFKPTYVKHLIC